MTADEDALFTIPPERFVAARDDLGARLKAAGEADRAREVRGLRRPTVAAWAVNMAVRRVPGKVAELTVLHDELVRAQRQMMSGVRGTDMADLTRRRRAAVDELVEQAAQAVAEHDRGLDGHLEDVRATFEAVVADPAAAATVMEGRLQRPLPAPVGFGTLAGLSLVPDGHPDPQRQASSPDRTSASDGVVAGDAAPADEPGGAAAARAAELRAQLAEAERLRTAVVAAAEEAVATARDLDRLAATTRRDADRATDQAARLEREAAAATARAKQAVQAARRAADKAEAAEARAGRARAAAEGAAGKVRDADALVETLRGQTADPGDR